MGQNSSKMKDCANQVSSLSYFGRMLMCQITLGITISPAYFVRKDIKILHIPIVTFTTDPNVEIKKLNVNMQYILY